MTTACSLDKSGETKDAGFLSYMLFDAIFRLLECIDPADPICLNPQKINFSETVKLSSVLKHYGCKVVIIIGYSDIYFTGTICPAKNRSQNNAVPGIPQDYKTGNLNDREKVILGLLAFATSNSLYTIV